MLVSQLLSLPVDVVVEELLLENQVLTLVLASTQSTRCCPVCSQPSSRIHSRYMRTLADLPCQGRLVRLQIEVRRFLCVEPTCRRATFAEQFPDLAAAYARRTSRQAEALCEVALALGGRAGAPLAKKLRLPTSRHTLLRLLRRSPTPVANTPRQVGIDDFAWKKGDHYGTILVDLARHRPVDLLADRPAESVTAWLLAHPEVELISRDRAGTYADAARRGAPKAVQVADRYHLVANLRDALQKLLDRKRSYLPILEETTSTADPPPTAMPTPLASLASQQAEWEDSPPQDGEVSSTTQAEALRQMRRGKRYERYQTVAALHRQGLGARTIARLVGISRNTVRSYLKAGTFPEPGLRSKRRSLMDPYMPYLRERWQAGCQNAAQLIREITSRAYQGSHTIVRTLVSDWRASSPTALRPTRGNKRKAPAPVTRRLSSRQASFLFIKRPDTLTETQRTHLEQITRASDDLQLAYELTQEFVSMIRKHQADPLDGWLEQVKAHAPRELKSFAVGLRRDYQAVRAGLSRPQSNAQVEGQITRLKLLKRQMYGKAHFDLLRLRVLHAA
jgi:transposase